MGPVLMRRFSRPILSADEQAEQIRAELDGHPQEWIDEQVKAALDERAAREAAAQAQYDKTPPTRPYAAPEGA